MPDPGTSPYEFKAGTLEPPLEAQLTDNKKQPIDLSPAQTVVFFWMRLRGASGSPIGGQVTIIQNGANDKVHKGQVAYIWQAGNTDAPGVYDGEFEIRWPGSRPQFVPSKEYLEIVIHGRVGESP